MKPKVKIGSMADYSDKFGRKDPWPHLQFEDVMTKAEIIEIVIGTLVIFAVFAAIGAYLWLG